MSEPTTFDIFVGKEKKGIAFDANPIFLQSHEECTNVIKELKNNLKLTQDESNLFDRCQLVLDSPEDTEVDFGPGEIIELSELAMRNPNEASKILACSNYLINCVECEGDIPQGFFLKLFDAHKELSNLLDKALKDGPIDKLPDDYVPDDGSDIDTNDPPLDSEEDEEVINDKSEVDKKEEEVINDKEEVVNK